MKKSIIALSALLLASPVFAAETATDTAAHASNEVVAEAHKGADTAKEKLHQSQDKGEELKLKAKHAAEGKSDSVGSKVSEGSQRPGTPPNRVRRRLGIRPSKGRKVSRTKRPNKVSALPQGPRCGLLLPANRVCPQRKGAASCKVAPFQHVN